MPSDPAISSLIDQLAAPAAEADAAGSKLIALGPAVVAVLAKPVVNSMMPLAAFVQEVAEAELARLREKNASLEERVRELEDDGEARRKEK